MRRLVDADHHEMPATLWGFVWFGCLLFAYYIMRPIRETLGVGVGPENLHWLFLAVFLVMLAAVPLYSTLVAQMPRRLLVPTVYHFFTGNVVIFSALIAAGGPRSSPWLSSAYYVWVSVFSLFAVSVFWSVMADAFHSDQGKRIFGFIAAGGTTGAMCGSLAAGQLVGSIGHAGLLLLAAGMLEIGLLCFRQFERSTRIVALPADVALETGDKVSLTSASLSGQATGGGPFEGIVDVVRSPYLLTICVYILLTTLSGTTVYSQQFEIVSAEISGDDERTSYFANINLYVQILTLFVQTFVIGRLMKYGGVTVALCVVPLVYCLAFIGLGLVPGLAMLSIVLVLTRTAVYAVGSPVREVLFTVVSREDKYKAKSFTDTVVVRGGDSLTSRLFSMLRSNEIGLTRISLGLIPVTLAWCGLAFVIGRRQHSLAKQRVEPPAVSTA